MTRFLARWSLFACLSLIPAAMAANTNSRLAGVDWLQANLGRTPMLLLDASPAQVHAAGHIPGAVNVDVFTFGGRSLSNAEMEQLIRTWGVNAKQKIVIYDQGGTYFATSLLFDLYYQGVPAENLVVLDGGMAKWQSVGGAVTKEATPPPRPGTFKSVKVREEVRVRLPEFLAASGDPAHNALLEALDPTQHFGEMKFFDRAGHVPNAIMAPAADFFNADKTFKSPEEVQRMLSYLGVKRDQQVLAHCGGGIAASVPFFAAKFMLDYPKVKLYKESQIEWLRDDRGLPFWTYDAPQLTRDKAWLNGWGAPMLRRFGVSKLAVIDVRSADAFRQSHLPFAINIPAEVFQRNAETPEKLGELLGSAGVRSVDEAVVVSQGGLNPDSALAFVMLERIGQKRVSVFADSVDEWAFAGFQLEKEGAAPRKVVPVAYPVALRSSATTRDDAGQPSYPKIYVASGKAMPAKTPEGKVVHVPYEDLVGAGGQPKAAKELWATLVKAGVPRYAEIVTFSDDPGEAAATYFIFRLMGYPDVKMLSMAR